MVIVNKFIGIKFIGVGATNITPTPNWIKFILSKYHLYTLHTDNGNHIQ